MSRDGLYIGKFGRERGMGGSVHRPSRDQLNPGKSRSSSKELYREGGVNLACFEQHYMENGSRPK